MAQEFTNVLASFPGSPLLSWEGLGTRLGIYVKVSCNSRLHAVSASCETKATSVTKLYNGMPWWSKLIGQMVSGFDYHQLIAIYQFPLFTLGDPPLHRKLTTETLMVGV